MVRKGELSLEVYTQNEQAVRFYTALGFLEVSRRSADDEGLPFENAHLRLNG
jgi:ribosomal protein S18 acetylase RimI-like enzyme